MDQFNSIKERVLPYLIDYGIEVISAVIILIVGLVLAKWVAQWARNYMERSPRFDATLTPLFVKVIKMLIIAFTLLAVLSKFGVQTASIIAVLGTIGLAVGLALQGTLSNVASGVMLIALRPIRVGDAVEVGGTTGVVDEIGLFVTHMHTFDNIAIIMPNSEVWGNKIENLSRNNTRRVDMQFGIGYDDNIDKAIKIIKAILDADERVLAEPETLIAVNTLGDNAVNIIVRPWTATDDVWPLHYDVTKAVKERFDEEGISFPFPQRDIHVFRESQAEE
ncbi:MAG TPA: mechanosensitive ion channel domain-containing protein [Balneolaceae bacterium]|nr:mechanosensitive ion channel domain-containing protein [Balneolaceae bacterium]